MADDEGRGGFRYTVSMEQLREFRGLTTEQKLEWLSKAQRFVWEASSPRAHRIQEMFRRGEI